MLDHGDVGPVEQSGQDKRLPEPCIFVVSSFRRPDEAEAAPELFHLRQAGLLPEEFAVVGVARRISPRHSSHMKDGIVKGGGVAETVASSDSFWIVSYTIKNRQRMFPRRLLDRSASYVELYVSCLVRFRRATPTTANSSGRSPACLK